MRIYIFQFCNKNWKYNPLSICAPCGVVWLTFCEKVEIRNKWVDIQSRDGIIKKDKKVGRRKSSLEILLHVRHQEQ